MLVIRSRRFLVPGDRLIPLAFGVMLIIPIGGADMPTVISLLNTYAGMSAAAMGFVSNSKLLIIAGELDGASGLILSIIMCKAMNRRSPTCFSAPSGRRQAAAAAAQKRALTAAPRPKKPRNLVCGQQGGMVPGYGMAVAQAQHKVRELYDISRSAASM